jgi:hypothetical protein
MKITISALYVEPGVSFEIPYTVIGFIREVLNKRLLKRYGLNEKQNDVWLSLIISTKREYRKAEAKGPDFDKENGCLTWGLWLPYEEIFQSPDQIKMFIIKFFEAIKSILVTYGIKPDDVEQAKDEVRKEVVGNDHYSHANLLPVDLSKIKL